MRSRCREILCLVVACVGAAAPAPPPGPLVGFPSAPGPTVAQIQAMADNTWLGLGSPAPDPQWGKGRGRSWSARMAYAPEFQAAFLTAEGVHGWWNTTTRRYMDDLWAYDANAHRWICLYPGAHVDTIDLQLDANGFERDKIDGQPIPVGQLCHGYEQSTYDSDRRKFMFMPCTGGTMDDLGAPLSSRRRTWLPQGTDPRTYVPTQCSPWMYDAATGRFDLRAVQGAFPGSHLGNVLVYVPSLGKAFFWGGPWGNNSVSFYDPAANVWEPKTPSGPPPPFGIDAVACLDSKRGRIYVAGGDYPVSPGSHAFWCYDLRTDAWVDLSPSGAPAGGSNEYGTNLAAMNYDSVNDRVVLCYHLGSYANFPRPAGKGIHVYDPAANAWSKGAALPAGFFPGLFDPNFGCVSSFYSPELNAHFFHVADDSEDNGIVWVYRYKRASGPSNQPPSISLTSPGEGATFTPPATIPVSATASDADGTVAKVDFFANGTPIGTVSASPYTMTWSGVVEGTHTLTARATDNGGAMTTSSPATISVTATPGGGGGGSKRDKNCGAMGIEFLVPLGVVVLLRRRRRALATLATLCAVSLSAGILAAQEPPAKKRPQGPLAGLPGAPGPHVAKIRALGDRQWLNLGSPASDPKWGKGRGRSWSARMPFVPDLRGAFLGGEGVHGFVKPDRHYMDDYFFYDINGHRWICVYPGMHVDSFEKKIKDGDIRINEHGVIAERDGQPLPIALLGHGYEALTYDPDARKLVVMDGAHGEWRTVEPLVRGFKTLMEQAGGRSELFIYDAKTATRPHSPYFYSPHSGRWERYPVESDHPKFTLGATLVYVPTRKQFFYDTGDHDVWFFDPAARKWSPVDAPGPKPPFSIEPGACYDSKRDRIYLGGGGYPVAPSGSNALWIFDLKTNSWVDPQPKGKPCRGYTYYGPNEATMNYDAVNDVVVVTYHGTIMPENSSRLGVYVYDPQANSWSDEPVPVPDAWKKLDGRCGSGFYDPELNAHFLHLAGDSEDDGTMWVYRHGRSRKER